MFVRRFLLLSLLSATLCVSAVGAALIYLMHAADEWRLYDPKVVADDKILWGGAFGQNRSGYKLARTLHLKPDLLILGSSRVTQFRAEMLPGVRTYNAGGGAASMSGAQAFLNNLYGGHRPKILILGIDEWWFWPDARNLGAEQLSQGLMLDRKEIAANLVNRFTPALLKTLTAPRAAVDPLGGRPTVGYRAGALAAGFRPDGSDQYGDIIQNIGGFDPRAAYAQDFKFYRQAVRQEKDRFSYTGPVSEKARGELKSIVETAKNLGIKVVLLINPYPHAIWTEIQTQPNQRRFNAQVQSVVEQVAAATGAELHVLHDLADLGLDDSYTLDGIHVDEVASLRQMSSIIRNSATLRSVVEISGLAALDELAAAAPEHRRHMVFP